MTELLERIRRTVREEVQDALAAAHQQEPGYLNTESAARYLDTTPQAIRDAVRRGDLHPYRRGNGRNARLSFTREQLDTYARGEAA
jgi:fido (protein-threonine AMPylation protein)